MTKANETSETRIKKQDYKDQSSINNFIKPKVLLKTPISYYGGKQNMLKHILPLVPEHKIYIEPFFGGGSLFRAKEPAKCEVINDVNMNLINFYQVLKNKGKQLETKIKDTLHSRETYKKAMLIYDCPRLFADDPVTRARAMYVVTNQGFLHRVWSWGFDKENRSSQVFKNKVDLFGANLIERIRYTQIEQNEAYKVIQSRDSENAFIYCDPPYINTNMGHYSKTYSEDDFKRDLEVLANIKWKFLLSNYPWEILNAYIKKYNRYVKTFDKPLSASHNNNAWKSRRKTEVLVANYPI